MVDNDERPQERPTVEDLERILGSDEKLKIEIQPNGEIRATADRDRRRAVVMNHEEQLTRIHRLVHGWGTADTTPQDDDCLTTKYVKRAVAEAQRLSADNFALAANQCKAGYSGEHGDHMCHLLDALRTIEAALVAGGEELAWGRNKLIDTARAAIKQAGGLI